MDSYLSAMNILRRPMSPWPKESFAERSSGGKARGYIREEEEEEEEEEIELNKGTSRDRYEMICVIQVQPSPLLLAYEYCL